MGWLACILAFILFSYIIEKAAAREGAPEFSDSLLVSTGAHSRNPTRGREKQTISTRWLAWEWEPFVPTKVSMASYGDRRAYVMWRLKDSMYMMLTGLYFLYAGKGKKKQVDNGPAGSAGKRGLTCCVRFASCFASLSVQGCQCQSPSCGDAEKRARRMRPR